MLRPKAPAPTASLAELEGWALSYAAWFVERKGHEVGMGWDERYRAFCLMRDASYDRYAVATGRHTPRKRSGRGKAE